MLSKTRKTIRETPEWQERPSQLINTSCMLGFAGIVLLITGLIYFIYNFEKNIHLVCIFSILYLFVLVFALYTILDTYCTIYILTSQRLRIKTGILNRYSEEIELYRVKDTSVYEPLFLRIFSKGNLELVTSDRTSPELTLRGVNAPRLLNDRIRVLVEQCRTDKGVREID